MTLLLFLLSAHASAVQPTTDCGEGYVLVAEEHDEVVPECDQFGCPEVDSCDACKETCDDESSCEAFECNVLEGKYSCSFNGRLTLTEKCGLLCQSQKVCVKNSTEVDRSIFVAPDVENRRRLLVGGQLAAQCNSGYVDKTVGRAYWWSCGFGCPGGRYWTDGACRCACGRPSRRPGLWELVAILRSFAVPSTHASGDLSNCWSDDCKLSDSDINGIGFRVLKFEPPNPSSVNPVTYFDFTGKTFDSSAEVAPCSTPWTLDESSAIAGWFEGFESC